MQDWFSESFGSTVALHNKKLRTGRKLDVPDETERAEMFRSKVGEEFNLQGKQTVLNPKYQPSLPNNPTCKHQFLDA